MKRSLLYIFPLLYFLSIHGINIYFSNSSETDLLFKAEVLFFDEENKIVSVIELESGNNFVRVPKKAKSFKLLPWPKIDTYIYKQNKRVVVDSTDQAFNNVFTITPEKIYQLSVVKR